MALTILHFVNYGGEICANAHPNAQQRPCNRANGYQALAAWTKSRNQKKLGGISEIVKIGTKVSSPVYGNGKVVGIEGRWVTVAFAKDAKRMRFDIVSAIQNGKLVI